jgi:glutamate racemase
MIVIACNSAATAAYDMLLDFYEGKVVFVNVVDPLVDAVLHSDSQKVGVIATKATVASDVYRKKIHKGNPNIDVQQLATPLLVPMIEEGYHSNKVSTAIISQYLSHESLGGIDTLLLACTHYPLIKQEIIANLPSGTVVLDSTDVVTSAVREALAASNLLASHRVREDCFYVSDYTASFAETARLFYGDAVDLQVNNIW